MRDTQPKSDRRIEGEEGTEAHLEGPISEQAGQTDRRGQKPPQKSRSTRQGNKRSTDGTPNMQKV